MLLAAESLAGGNGGICRVARLMARVLGEEASAGRVAAEAWVLSDGGDFHEFGFPVRSCRGARLEFVLGIKRALWRHSQALYDFAGMARAHGVIGRWIRPYACWMHGIEVWERARRDRVSWSRHADLLLVNSEYTRRRATALHRGLDHARVCWLATESDTLPERRADMRRPHEVLIVGRLDGSRQDHYLRYKGHEELIDCWPEVVRQVPEARLSIVGTGAGREEVEARARASTTSASIEFRGFVPDDRLDAEFERASLFAMPSKGEGFGLVFIEAMRYGLPVIASKHDAAPEINLEGVTGFNVDLGNRAELPARIVQLLQDRQLARQMGEAGRRRWQEHFRFSAFRKRFLELLNPWLRGEIGKRAARRHQTQGR